MPAQSHRPRRTALASLAAAVAIAALPALANAGPAIDHGVPAIPVNALGTDVAAQDQQAPRPVVNAPGTDVAAQDQQAPRPVVNAPGTDVAAVDQQAPIVDNPGPRQPRRRPGRLAADARGARTDRARPHARRPGARLEARRHAPTHPRGGLNTPADPRRSGPHPAGRFGSVPYRRDRPGREIQAEGEGFEPSNESPPLPVFKMTGRPAVLGSV